MSDPANAPPQDETTLSIGRLNPAIYIVPLKRAHPGAVDRADGNWIDARVSINAGMFHGDYAACLRSDEMHYFRQELLELADGRRKLAKYSSMEGWLTIEIHDRKYGHYFAECVARDDAGSPNQLHFAIEIDKSQPEALLIRIEGWLRHLPAFGI